MSSSLWFTTDEITLAANLRIIERLRASGFPEVRPAHGKVFEHVGDGRRVSEMAERAQVTKQSMGELVATLERAGYVERVPDPTDRRAQLVRTTARGHAAANVGREVLDELYEDLVDLLGAAELRRLERGLERIAERLSGR